MYILQTKMKLEGFKGIININVYATNLFQTYVWGDANVVTLK